MNTSHGTAMTDVRWLRCRPALPALRHHPTPTTVAGGCEGSIPSRAAHPSPAGSAAKAS